MSHESPHKQTPGAEKEPQFDPEKLTPKYLAKLFFLSFRYSQGKDALQKEIYRYLKLSYPNFEIPYELRKELEEVIKPMFEKYMKKSGHTGGGYITEKKTKEVAKEELENMQLVFNNFDTSDIEQIRRSVVDQLTLGIVSRDATYMLDKTRDSTKDKALSHLCAFGILGQPTGASEYNAMFRDVVNNLRSIENEAQDGWELKIESDTEPFRKQWSGGFNWITSQNIDEIITVWNLRHPDQQIDRETLTPVEQN